MSEIREYIRGTANQNNELLKRIRQIQADISSLADDVESNAAAIMEIGEILGDKEG
jgi:uncharacterized protein YoxC